jgi:hypothetical protein
MDNYVATGKLMKNDDNEMVKRGITERHFE